MRWLFHGGIPIEYDFNLNKEAEERHVVNKES